METIKDIAPDDVIGAIIAYSGLDLFSSSKRFLHSTIYSFCREHGAKYPELFEDFLFSQGDAYPFSRLLERVLIRLQTSGIIAADNPRYRRFRMEQKARLYMMENSKKRLSEYSELLALLGNQFAEEDKRIGKEE